ncbi:glutathione S-transferase 2-like isoform X3 [Zerene cesonia]|uniref:glutathione S-transferase 2-like isoform X3 n=1 Tax=Zerene cesonia TaxID=33412 RepID=UPI0018E5813D|nr:glutathione S-transferase 2-like isoform X3 [Zerene cesonia]XP_038222283.1 glutathione S-transferase 2-like isoform X3 [Zerene cesonia]XP_038222284.1 glutathione S-transferase 2-like isoform X3 [Zerene cesonia]
MPKVVFKYFEAKAVGEPIRLLLAYGGQEFEDQRIPFAQWPSVKPTTPFGQMPVLEIDGKQYAQSLAIARYLGRKYGVAGDNAEEEFEIDQMVDYINETRTKAVVIHYEQDAELKEKKHAENAKNVYPVFFKKLDEVIKKNNGHIAAGKLTWADFIFAGLFDYFKLILRVPDLEKQYPSFQQVVDAVYTIPNVKAFSEKAPKCDF